MENSKPSYYAIVPANVRYCKSIPDGAKLLYGEITALANQKGYCFATNNNFAKLYNKSTRTIQNWIKALVREGFIYVDISYIGKDNSQRKIYLMGEKNFMPPMKKTSPPHEKNFTHNSTLNIKDNNNTVNPLQDRQKEASKDSLIREYLEAINKELSKYGKSLAIPKDDKLLKKYYAYKDVKYTIKDYKATIEQWVKVVAHKGKEWGGTENSKHLNTTTIKRHFSRYLEEASNVNNVDNSKNTSEGLKKHPRFKELYAEVQRVSHASIKHDSAKITALCFRFLDKFGVGVDEAVDRFDKLLNNQK